jgi:hypothetical protein
VTSLTRELKKPDSPIRRHLHERFPNVPDLQRPYAQATAGLTPIEPRPGAKIAYGTLGTAFDWQVRFLVERSPDLRLAFAGAWRAGKDLLSLCGALTAEVGGSLTLGGRPGPPPPRPAAPAGGHRAAALDAERLARACWALALFTEVHRRSGLVAGSPLALLDPAASLEELLDLASADEIADLLALADAARRELVPVLDERGGKVHVGPTFAGSVDLAADADLIAGGLLLELKVNLGSRRSDGRRRCSLERLTLYELLGYLLLDYENAYRVEALGVYSARYAHLAIWPLAELLDVLAGGPVDLAQARTEFRQVVLATPNPRRDLRTRMQARRPRPTGRANRRRSRP